MNRRICILDDDPVSATIAQVVVQRFTDEVTTFASVEPMLEHLRTQRVDILVLDLQLPDASGVQVLERVREMAPFTRVVVVTGFLLLNELLACWRLGADGVVLKGAQFSERLEACLRRAAAALDGWELAIGSVRERLQQQQRNQLARRDA